MSKTQAFVGGASLIAVLGVGFYFMIQGPQAQATVDQSDPVVIAEGKVVYQGYCASCHGRNLEGQPNWQHKKEDGTLPAPPHDKDGHTWHHADGMLFNYVKKGAAAMGVEGFKSGMPTFGSALKDQQIWAALAYIKSTWPEKQRARQAMATKQAQAQGQN